MWAGMQVVTLWCGYVLLLPQFCGGSTLSLEPKRSSKWPPFYSTAINSPVRCAFGVLMCGSSAPRCSFHLPLGSSSSCSKTISWAVHLDTTTSILKRLCYSRGIGQVQIYDNSSARYEQKARYESIWWQSFVLESSASSQRIENVCHVPF